MDLWPVEAISSAGDQAVGSLLRGRMQKAGIPRQRSRDGPAVCQLDKDGILSAGNSHDSLTRIRHELPLTPSANHRRDPRSTARRRVTLALGNQEYSPG